MYKRDIVPPPEHIVLNGRPIFGTFNAPPKLLEIRGIQHPFGNIPFPKFLTNLRIRSMLSFVFFSGNHIGVLELFDAKVFSNVEFLLWDTQTGKRFVYRKTLGPRYRFIPKSLDAAMCVCFSRRRYIRISWNRALKRFTLMCNMAGDSVYPQFSAAFTSSMDPSDESAFGQLFTVTPAPITRRCSSLYQFFAQFKGTFTAGQSIEYPDATGLCYFNIGRTYYPFRIKDSYVLGIGVAGEKKIVFRLYTSSLDAKDEDSYNHNVLFVDGKVTPLPPVKITRPNGVLGHWIIQDTESMIDLQFTPIADCQKKYSLLIVHSDAHNLSGTFDGMILDSDGIQYALKGFTGIGKKMRLRI